MPLANPRQALARAAGLELDAYRDEHVDERVRRALERERVPDEPRLARLLASDPRARRRFRRSVAVSVSGLFRDPAQFRLLEASLLPELLASRRRLTCWSAGCANGAELYSLAMLLDSAGALERSFLLGSDLLEENLAEARLALYPAAVIPRHVRDRVRWERRDLVREGAPPGKWRLVLCCNVAIYLAGAARQALDETLAASLAHGGILMLGRAERLGDPAALGLERVAPHTYRKSL